MKANHHNKFTQGMIKGRELNPEYYIPPGADHERIVAPPPQQSQADQVLKRQTVRQKKSKYQRD
jgi:hypothetical protein